MKTILKTGWFRSAPLASTCKQLTWSGSKIKSPWHCN